MRREHPIDDLTGYEAYRLLNSVVIPRPIAWVSSRSADGVDNLAPHSFFTVASNDPPIVQFTSIGEKDSLRNIAETGEFVVCLSPEPLFEQINATGTNYPAGVSEFDAVGLEREASAVVAPPRVAASPVAIECRLHSTSPVGSGIVVFGQVLQIAVDERAFAADGLPDPQLLAPLTRLGRNEWGTLGEVRRIDRIRYGE